MLANEWDLNLRGSGARVETSRVDAVWLFTAPKGYRVHGLSWATNACCVHVGQRSRRTRRSSWQVARVTGEHPGRASTVDQAKLNEEPGLHAPGARASSALSTTKPSVDVLPTSSEGRTSCTMHIKPQPATRTLICPTSGFPSTTGDGPRHPLWSLLHGGR